MSENTIPNQEFQIPNSKNNEIYDIASGVDVKNGQETAESVDKSKHIKDIAELRRLAEAYIGSSDGQKIEHKTFYPEVALTMFIGKAIKDARAYELEKAA